LRWSWVGQEKKGKKVAVKEKERRKGGTSVGDPFGGSLEFGSGDGTIKPPSRGEQDNCTGRLLTRGAREGKRFTLESLFWLERLKKSQTGLTTAP